MPKRLPSGHRRYDRSVVEFLQAASELADYGHRPGKILGLPAVELQALVTKERLARNAPNADKVERAIHAGGNNLRILTEASFRELGIRQTLHEFLVPLITRIGQAWAEQTIDIHQEHILSEAIEDVLRSARMQIPMVEETDDNFGLLLATLPGERHGLGLQVLALLAALEGSAPLVLGVDLPLSEIAHVAHQHPDAAVGISVSSAADTSTITRQLQELRRLLPPKTGLLAGGSGMARRQPMNGIQALTDLSAFEAWLRQRESSSSGRNDVR